ncbi:hypothetical protein SAMN06296241_0512 [Salinimicrobium sediminis]|uniref:Cytochrome C and Quinol oxidase polypeptide I n=1 Tax=Salinimicrobium sediminis TaxID=1343891 RepID=A0A285X0Z5_9FLAO|nr:hypothetical protein [Salinimicrobium sediminis]SOC78992.1 hypothetical protein SAMN06296241_0512 [Salinimicrobium sediminis]
MINLKNHTNVALLYFFLVGLFGVFLRFFFVLPIPANFRYVVHAHSHIALLGWVYIALTTLIYKMYFSEAGFGRTYKRIFWFTQITLVGMMVTFPFTGYALFSITFSTLFLIASYFMAWFILKKTPAISRTTGSFRLIRAALWYMVFSSIGPWALGGIMATLGNTSIWYKMAIYYYLHFQYNAWFILALCGIFFYFIERQNLKPQKKDFKSFFWQVNAAVILSFFLSVLWVEPHWSYHVLAGIGAILQVSAFAKFFQIISPFWKQLDFSTFTKVFLKIVGILLVAKLLLQLLSAIPWFANLAFNFPDLVIGYLHWVFLGVVSIALFALLTEAKLLTLPKWIFWVYFAAFLVTEALIFYKGTAIWLGLPLPSYYFKLVAYASIFLPLTVGVVLVKNLLTKRQISAKYD